jgi:hypothetical protein
MLLITIALLGCKPSSSGEQPDQLEAPEVSNALNPQDAITIEGNDTFVDGADRDWVITMSIEGEKYGNETEWHVPGASDLSVLEGSSLRIELGGTWSDDTQTARIDQDGSPRFLIQLDAGGGPATELFGADFVSFGDEVGTGTMKDDYGTWEVSYKKAVFATDDGPVEADPGEPFVATIDGEDWRIVVHGSFEVTDEPDTLPGCGGGIGTTLSFEMLKVDATPPTDPVAPLAGARQVGHSSCG